MSSSSDLQLLEQTIKGLIRGNPLRFNTIFVIWKNKLIFKIFLFII